MFRSKTSMRVRYSETDRMGYAYHGNYAQYFEVARIEALREMGLNYKDMEDRGILLPVFELQTKYFKPAYYDDLITVETIVEEMPKVRFFFKFNTFNEAGEKLCEGKITLVFVDSDSRKPIAPPQWVIDELKEIFKI